MRRSDLAAAAEAFATLAATSIALRTRPFANVVKARPVRPALRPCDPKRLASIVARAARILPLRAKCIEKSLALQAMLARRGVATILHYGLQRDGAGALAGHAWLSLDGVALIGGREAADFTQVAEFPAARG